jgi:hypothetical protein
MRNNRYDEENIRTAQFCEVALMVFKFPIVYFEPFHDTTDMFF